VRLCWDNQRDAKLGNVDEFVNRLG
jgi:hypothetical protein